MHAPECTTRELSGRVRLAYGRHTLALQSCESTNTIDGFRHHDGFTMHLYGQVHLALVDRQRIFPYSYLPHVAAGTAKVPHQLHGGVERNDSIIRADERDSRLLAKCVTDLLLADRAGSG